MYQYNIVILCMLNYYCAGGVSGYMHQVQMDFCENFGPAHPPLVKDLLYIYVL